MTIAEEKMGAYATLVSERLREHVSKHQRHGLHNMVLAGMTAVYARRHESDADIAYQLDQLIARVGRLEAVR